MNASAYIFLFMAILCRLLKMPFQFCGQKRFVQNKICKTLLWTSTAPLFKNFSVCKKCVWKILSVQKLNNVKIFSCKVPVCESLFLKEFFFCLKAPWCVQERCLCDGSFALQYRSKCNCLLPLRKTSFCL